MESAAKLRVRAGGFSNKSLALAPDAALPLEGSFMQLSRGARRLKSFFQSKQNASGESWWSLGSCNGREF